MGIPTEAVKEVVDVQPVTPLPFSPSYVKGLVNVSGEVIAKVDLAELLDLDQRLMPTQGQLIIVEHNGLRSAVHIESALVMVQVDEADTTPPEEGSSGAIVGEIRWEDKMVLLLSPEKLGLEEMSAATVEGLDDGLISLESERNDEEHMRGGEAALLKHAAEQEGHSTYLVVHSGVELYAIPLEYVHFVQEMIEHTKLPTAPREVIGLIYTHQQPHLVLSLAIMIGANQPAVGKKLVVIEFEGNQLALCVDDIVGINRLQQKENYDSSVENNLLSGYLVDKEEQLIGVINAEAIFHHKETEDLERFLVSSEKVKSEKIKKKSKTQSMLTFSVGTEECALPLELVNRVVKFHEGGEVPDGGREHLHGVVQIQGDVFPVSDMRQMFSSEKEISDLTAYVIAGGENGFWALVVDQIHNVVEVSEDMIDRSARNDNNHVESIVRIDGRLVSMIDLAKLTRESVAA